jgi:hypothetical protein
MKYETRIRAIEKGIPKDNGGPFVSYHLERDNLYLGPNDERLTWEDLDAMDCNMMVMGWQRDWTEQEIESNRLNAQRHNLRDWLEGMRRDNTGKYLETIPKIETEILEIEDEMKRKGLTIEEERDNRFGADALIYKIKGKGWL